MMDLFNYAVSRNNGGLINEHEHIGFRKSKSYYTPSGFYLDHTQYKFRENMFIGFCLNKNSVFNDENGLEGSVRLVEGISINIDNDDRKDI